MSWNFCQIVDAEHDQPALYPVLGRSGDSLPVELEPLDGHVASYAATGMQISVHQGGTLNKVFALDEVNMQVLVTEARVIVYCEKWTKSGGWMGFGVGGLAVALAANAVSKARAAGRRKGKLLVGQIRYPWLAAAGGLPKEGWKTMDQLRLTVDTGSKADSRLLSVDLHLPKHAEPLSVAAVITRNAARYRLKHTPLSTEEIEAFTALTSAPVLSQAGARTFAMHRFPTFHYVRSDNAYPTAPVVVEPVPVPNPTAAGTESEELQVAGDLASRSCIHNGCELRGRPTSDLRCTSCDHRTV